MRRNIFILALLVLIPQITLPQGFMYYPVRTEDVENDAIKKHHYWVQFTDKNKSEYSIDRPEEFLSQRAIKRRQKYNITLDKTDLPVCRTYLDIIKKQGVNVLFTSKWFNAVVIYAEDYLQVDAIRNLPFVATTRMKPIRNRPADKYHLLHQLDRYKTSNTDIWTMQLMKLTKTSYSKDFYNYGWSRNQIEMLNGINLHNWNFKGQGIHIAAIDAGFYKVNNYQSFDSLFINNQILGMHDFVDSDTIVTDESFHGIKVLSTMGANLPETLIGTSPKAKYWLLRTENAHQENIIEEAYWIAAAEFADSAGVDVINTSLGYNDFDIATQSYSTDDLNGYSSLMTIAQNMVARKGMLSVTSAGNTGWSEWKYLTVPADADSTLAVGAVDMTGEFGAFSAKGPTTDGRIKPNVVARGVSTVVQDGTGGISFSNGTSFSSPIMAGMIASFWQSHPELTNMQLLKNVELFSHNYYKPDTMLGYGIPDYTKMVLFANGIHQQSDYLCSFKSFADGGRSVVANTAENNYLIHRLSDEYKIYLKDITGNLILSETQVTAFYSHKGVKIKGFKELPRGAYHIEIMYKNDRFSGWVFK